MLEEQVRLALDNVRPSLQNDGGDVEFVSLS
ncbi:MAG: NifU family protein, partial [Treponema sp.]|nr:NifU family protein [Treponema sp.]